MSTGYPPLHAPTTSRRLRLPLAVLIWAINGGGVYLAAHYWLLDDERLKQAMGYSALVLAVGVWWWFRSERRRASALGQLLFENEWPGFFVVAAPLSLLPCWAVALNGYLDTSLPQRQQALVLGKELVDSPRSVGKHLVIKLRDDRVPGQTLRFGQGNIYSWAVQVQPGDRVWLTTGSGYWGWIWCVNLSPAEPIKPN